MTTPEQIKAIERGVALVGEWRCWHCDEVFTDPNMANEHFGESPMDEPGCKLNALEGGILALYREAQRELHSYRMEDTATSREFYALGAKHQTALREAEQAGYDKGLADGRALTAAGEMVGEKPGWKLVPVEPT